MENGTDPKGFVAWQSPTQTALRAKYNIRGIFSSGLPAAVQVKRHSNLKGSLKVPFSTKLQAKYDISGIELAYLNAAVKITTPADTPSNVTVSYRSYARARYQVEPKELVDFNSSVTVANTTNMAARVKIPYENRVASKYSLEERKKSTAVIPVDIDAYVRKNSPKQNFGKESKFYVGSDALGDRYRSFIGFKLNSIPKVNTLIGKAILRVYYEGRSESEGPIQLHEVLSPWTEDGITWNGHPRLGEIKNSFSVFGQPNVVDIDVTSTVSKWQLGELENNGFALIAENELVGDIKGFRAKEGVERRPELHVTYYDMQAYSYGYTSLSSSVTVVQAAVKDLKGRLRIPDYKGNSDIFSKVFVHNERELPSRMTVNKPNLQASAIVRRNNYKVITSKVKVRVSGYSELPITYKINEQSKPARVIVPHRDDLIGSLFVEGAEEKSYLSSTVKVARGFELPGSVQVTIPNSLPSKVVIPSLGTDELSGHLILPYRDEVEGSLQVSNPLLKGHVEVFSVNTLKSSVTVACNDFGELTSTILVSRQGEGDLLSRVKLSIGKYMDSQVIVNSPYLRGAVQIPTHESKDLYGNLTVRVIRLADLPSTVEIKKLITTTHDLKSMVTIRQGTAYVFIM
ncbi:DNRLRE domain-containing protein [Bacillus pumilus]|uniref:DNRLRE domain-containing protein n=1 Tax=Bacillus TaxID=1386 RepID=UPI001C24DC55|nr:DNRLRE domain-containing protein [Bacillus pumilus]MBU8576386.1 DNRLRE domain-containing protein [Bacillus pumilus]